MTTLQSFFLGIANNDIYIIISIILTTLALINLATNLYVIFSVMRGGLAILYKLSLKLSNKKIYIFAEANMSSLYELLLESNIFKASDIKQIHANRIDRATEKAIFLVYWKDLNDAQRNIILDMTNATALIIYSVERIDKPEHLEKINNRSNCTLVNFRGRLLNDILVSLVTSSL